MTRFVKRYIPAPIVSVALTLSAMLGVILSLQPAPHTDHLHFDPLLFAELATTSTPLPFTPTAPRSNIPVVVYHIVRPHYDDDSEAVRALAQTPEVFDAQLRHLGEAGYHVIPLSDLTRHLRYGTPLPTKPIVLTFDDGWINQYLYAFPILKKYGYPATFFVFTHAIGHRGFMTWDNLSTLRDTGMSIGSHSLSHPYLTQITDPTRLTAEIVDSKKILEERVGIPITDFAYPFGQFTPAIAGEVEKAGYASARGDFYSGEQTAAKLYALSAMNAPTTLERFRNVFP